MESTWYGSVLHVSYNCSTMVLHFFYIWYICSTYLHMTIYYLWFVLFHVYVFGYAFLHSSFTCACNSGYYLYDSDRHCSDVIECNQPHACPQHSDCYNTIGSYGCTCHEGYHKSSASRCSNINECSNGTHNCSQLPNQHCIGLSY